MNRFFLTIEASVNTPGGAIPTLEVLIGGIVVSSGMVTAQTGVGVNLLNFEIDYTGLTPSSLQFRINGGDGGDVVSLETVRINGTRIDTANDLTAEMISLGNPSDATIANVDHLFGRIEPGAGDLGTPDITGTAGADDLRGGGDDEIIDALGGDDFVRGNGGDDTVYGGAGDDTIHGSPGNDLLYGGDDDDRIFGEEDNDLLYGGNGNDLLSGGAGNDTLSGGAGDDSLVGGAANDILYGEGGADTLVGDDGDDLIHGDAGIDSISGGAGDDTIYGGDDLDYIVGDAGDDTIYGDGGDDQVDGLADDDTIYGGTGDDLLAGNIGNDTIYGEADDDTLFGDQGTDTLHGGVGNDGLLGGAGADTLNGDAGNDILQGHALDILSASLIVFGNPGVTFNPLTNSFYQLVSTSSDFTDAQFDAETTLLNGVSGHLVTISSAQENSYVQGVAGGNEIWLGALDTGLEGDWRWSGGNDDGLLFYSGGTAQNGVYTNWNTGQPNDSGGGEDHAVMRTDGRWNDIDGSGTRFYVIEWDGADFSDDGAIDTLNGGDGVDQLYGHDGNDILNGDAGDDQIAGGAGNDTMNGGTGDDYIRDAEGTNTFNGNDGNDVLDARFQTAVPTTQEQVNRILTENPGVVYNAATGNFYQFVDAAGGGVTHATAKAAANAATIDGVGGYLTNVSSAAENTFVNTQVTGGNSVWIGGTDAAVAGTWIWDEGDEAGTTFFTEPGTTVVYANWTPGEPNNDGPSTVIRMQTDGSWTDRSGAQNYDYVIEWEGDQILVPPPVEPVQTTQTMNGGDGNDTLYGGNGNDIMNGDADDDYIEGRNGNDTISGGSGSDTLLGGTGNDTINGNSGNDTLYALYVPGSSVALDVDFTSGADGFTYSDGGFGGTDPGGNNASGTHITTDGGEANGALEIYLDGQSNTTETNISGSWDETFNVSSPITNAALSFSYRLFHDTANDTGEDVFLYVEVDGTRYGLNGSLHIDSAAGSAGTTDTGWVTVSSMDIGGLTIGNHTVSIGILKNSKSAADEDSWVRLDDIRIFDSESLDSDTSATNTLNGGGGNDTLYGSDGTDTLNGGDGNDTLRSDSDAIINPVTLLSSTFDADSGNNNNQDGFAYTDGGFGGTDPANANANPAYVGGDGGAANGSLEVRIDGLNTAASTNISGSWDSSITTGASSLSNVEITFAYRHWHSGRTEAGEDSQVWFDFNGTTYDGSGGNSFINEHLGVGGNGANLDTGWTTVTISLPDLAANTTYTLSMGILQTAENRADEDSLVRFDDVVITGDEIDNSIFTTLNGQDGLDNLYGSDGIDHFMFESASAFNDIDVIHDFDRADGDAIDLSDVLSGLGVNAGNLSQYVDISLGNGVRVDTGGSGSFAGNSIASFSGTTNVADEATLLTNGNLII